MIPAPNRATVWMIGPPFVLAVRIDDHEPDAAPPAVHLRFRVLSRGGQYWCEFTVHDDLGQVPSEEVITSIGGQILMDIAATQIRATADDARHSDPS